MIKEFTGCFAMLCNSIAPHASKIEVEDYSGVNFYKDNYSISINEQAWLQVFQKRKVDRKNQKGKHWWKVLTCESMWAITLDNHYATRDYEKAFVDMISANKMLSKVNEILKTDWKLSYNDCFKANVVSPIIELKEEVKTVTKQRNRKIKPYNLSFTNEGFKDVYKSNSSSKKRDKKETCNDEKVYIDEKLSNMKPSEFMNYILGSKDSINKLNKPQNARFKGKNATRKHYEDYRNSQEFYEYLESTGLSRNIKSEIHGADFEDENDV